MHRHGTHDQIKCLTFLFLNQFSSRFRRIAVRRHRDRENKASDGIVLILTVAFPCEYISRHALIAWDNAIHQTYHQVVKNVIGGGNKKYRSPGQAVPRGFAARCLSPRLLLAASPLIFATLQVCHRAQIT